MAQLTVTSTELRSVATDIGGGRNDIETILTGLRSKVDTLVAAEWTGAASDSFNGLYTQWQTSASSLLDALEQIGLALQGSAETYEATEEQIAGQFSQ